jgi:hypothetical protein
MPLYWRRRLTRLEVGLYAAIVGVLIAVFLERMLVYMELAERTAMIVTVNNVNSALNIQRALALLDGKPEKQLHRNPFDVASVRVPNRHPDMPDREKIAQLERGFWVYDESRRELVYLPNLHRRLHTDDPQGTVPFRLLSDPRALVLVPAVHYSWE